MDPRNLTSSIDFPVIGSTVHPVIGYQEYEHKASDFGLITLQHLIRANACVKVVKDDGTVLTYRMKDRPVPED